MRLLRQLSFLGELLLGLVIFLSCARIIIATLQSAAFPAAIASAAFGFALIGFFFSRHIGEIYAAAFPFSSGLALTHIFPDPNLPLLALGASIVGSTCRDAARWVRTPAALRRWLHHSTRRRFDWPIAGAMLMGLTVAASATRAATLMPPDSGWVTRLLKQASFGYGDPCYFISSASLWLMGLGYFNLCRRAPQRQSGRLTLVLLVVTCTTPAFLLLQHFRDLPSPGDTGNLAAPFEEFHAFGSVVAGILLYVTVLLVWRVPHGRIERAGAAAWFLALAMLVAVSWSRTAWFLAFILIPAIIATRRPRGALVIMATLAVLVAMAVSVPRQYWDRSGYMERLKSLTRPGSTLGALTGRADLTHKARAMIAERPGLGHGIGAFYIMSPRYARADDPLGAKPEFAHNAFLQFAAELGVPALLGWLMIPALALGRGLGSLRMLVRCGPDQHHALRFAAALALLGFLLTQLTSNSVNIFLSNQLFLWLLTAVLLSHAQTGRRIDSGT